MRKIDRLLTEYGESHQNVTNKTIHWICVPLIFFSIVGMIMSIPSGSFFSFVPLDYAMFANWATIGLILALVYYLTLSLPLFLGMIAWSLFCTWGNNIIAATIPVPLWLISLVIFVLAWIGQFYGHKIEGKKPSFLKDFQFLLIGPAWLMHFIFKKLSIPY